LTALTLRPSATISYVYPGKAYYTYYCYTNSENPAILVNIADLADSNGKISYPTNMDVSKVSGIVNAGWMSYTYDGGTRAGTIIEGSTTVNNSRYEDYTIGMNYDTLGSDYYKQSGYLVLKPEFVQAGGKQFARYTISGVDDASATGNTADSTSLAGGTTDYANGKLLIDVPNTPHPTWTPAGTVTIYVEYRNAMSLEGGEWYDDGRATTSFKAHNNLGADDTWVSRDYLYRNAAGATNDEIVKPNDTIYPSNDPNFGQTNYGCFYYPLDEVRDADIIAEFASNGHMTATNMLVDNIRADAAAYAGDFTVWLNTAWSISHTIKTPSRLVYVHLADRWGNVFNKIIKVNNVDYEYPSFADITYGSVTLNESGGSGVTLIRLYEYAYEGGPSFVVPFYSDKLIETINVINEPDNVLDISAGYATVADGTQNRFTLYTKDKAGNEKTQTVYTDAAGDLSITVNDPENMSPPQQKSGGARTMSESSANIYTFLLNDTITVNLNNPTQAQAYTITFDLNGGTSAAIDQIVLEEGAEVTPPADPVREGYFFAGWEPAVPETMPAENITCTAQWTTVVTPVLNPAEGSTAVIDDNRNFIYGLTEGIGRADFESMFVEVLGNGRLEIKTLAGEFGTGTKIELINNTTDEVVREYYIVIFGDLNGDGIVGGIDADLITNYENFIVEWDPETEPYLFAAGDLDGNTNLEALDADIIINVENFSMWIDQTTGLAYAF
jgi:hypothetical protein